MCLNPLYQKDFWAKGLYIGGTQRIGHFLPKQLPQVAVFQTRQNCCPPAGRATFEICLPAQKNGPPIHRCNKVHSKWKSVKMQLDVGSEPTVWFADLTSIILDISLNNGPIWKIQKLAYPGEQARPGRRTRSNICPSARPSIRLGRRKGSIWNTGHKRKVAEYICCKPWSHIYVPYWTVTLYEQMNSNNMPYC